MILLETLLMNMHISGVREATHGPHLHAMDGAAVGATAEVGAGAVAIGMTKKPCACFFSRLFLLAVVFLVFFFFCHAACFNIPFLLSSAAQDPYLDLLGEAAVTVVRGDQGALATAGAPCDLPPLLQRSTAVHLMEAGAQGVPVPGVR